MEPSPELVCPKCSGKNPAGTIQCNFCGNFIPPPTDSGETEKKEPPRSFFNLVLALGLAGLGAWAVYLNFRAPEWKEYISPDEPFSVQTPGPPQWTEGELPVAGGAPARARTYSARGRAGELFQVIYLTLAPGARDGPALDALELSARRAVGMSADPALLDRAGERRTATLGGHHALEVEFSDAAGSLAARAIADEHRIFLAAAGRAGGPLSAEARDRFFRSFSLRSPPVELRPLRFQAAAPRVSTAPLTLSLEEAAPGAPPPPAPEAAAAWGDYLSDQEPFSAELPAQPEQSPFQGGKDGRRGRAFWTRFNGADFVGAHFEISEYAAGDPDRARAAVAGAIEELALLLGAEAGPLEPSAALEARLGFRDRRRGQVRAFQRGTRVCLAAAVWPREKRREADARRFFDSFQVK